MTKTSIVPFILSNPCTIQTDTYQHIPFVYNL